MPLLPESLKRKVFNTTIYPIQQQIEKLISTLSIMDRLPGRETHKYKDVMKKTAMLNKKKIAVETALAKKLITMGKTRAAFNRNANK